MGDFFEFMVGLGVVLCLALAAIFVPVYFLVKYECSTYEKVTGTKTELHFPSCYVELNGKMLPWSEYKARIIASDSLSKGDK